MRILLIILFVLCYGCTKSQVAGILKNANYLSESAGPTDLTWTEYENFRVNEIIDDNFVHYQSNYSSTIAEVSAVSGTHSQVGGALQVGAGLYKTTTAPKVNWFSVQMVVSAGTSGSAGPAIVKDASNYLAADYNRSSGVFRVLVNGSVVMTKNGPSGMTTPTITLTLMKTAVNVWYSNGGANVFVGHVENSVSDLATAGIIPAYRYGVYSSGGTHSVTSLKGAANGGANIFNQRFVRNSDGSPYVKDGKYVITGDWTALAETPTEGQAYRYANNCIFTLDINTFEIESAGHIYYTRDEPGDATVRYYGGQDMKLTWYESEGKFLMTTVLCDHYNTATPPQEDDPYVWLTAAEVFGETIVDESRFNQIGINRTTYPNLMYDFSNILYKNGTYYVAAGETNAVRGTGWSLVTPILFSGASLSSMTMVDRYNDGSFQELVSWARVNGTDYLLYQGFGENNNYAFTFPGLDEINRMQIGTASPTTAGYIGGFDFLTHQHNGITEYYLLGFDTQEAVYTDVSGMTKRFWYSIGNVRILKANEQKQGYEFQTQ